MDTARQLDGFIDKFTPDVAALARACLVRMIDRLPGATIPVYDNYNALAIGFGASDRVKDVILSLAVMPRWVDLYFMWGTRLTDPGGLLTGGGNQGRHVKIHDAAMLDDPRIEALIAEAMAIADRPIDPAAAGGIVIKSISAKQRPRRPAGA